MTKQTMSKILAGLIAGSMLLAGCTTTGDSGPSTSAPATDGGTTATEDGGEDSGTTTASGDKILRLNNSSEPGSLHPSLAQGTHDSHPLNHMFEGLYEKDPDGGLPIFAGAESVEVSEDGLTLTFALSPNAKWSNGDPVVAQDYVTSYRFCADPATAANYASQMYALENGEAVVAGEKPVEELGVTAIDDLTLELKLSNPMPYFADYLTHYTFYPVHTATQEEFGGDWALTPDNYITNGAMVLTEWRNKESFTLMKNPHFRRADDVKLDGMFFTIVEDMSTTWQMYQNGELDANYPIPPAVIEQLRNDNDPSLHAFEELTTEYYTINTQKAPFNNVKVRQALGYSIDRKALVDNVTKGGEIPAYSITPPGISDGNGIYQENLGAIFSEDFEGARALLEEGLAEEGMSIDDFTFTLLYNTNETHKKNAEAIQAMWIQNLGIQCNLENAEFQIVLDRRGAGDYDVSRAGWVGDYSDPMTFVELAASWSEFNYSKWNNPEADALITAAMTSTDNQVRMESMKQAETMWVEEMAVIPLFFKVANWNVAENISGYFKPVNRYVLFMYADMQ